MGNFTSLLSKTVLVKSNGFGSLVMKYATRFLRCFITDKNVTVNLEISDVFQSLIPDLVSC